MMIAKLGAGRNPRVLNVLKIVMGNGFWLLWPGERGSPCGSKTSMASLDSPLNRLSNGAE